MPELPGVLALLLVKPAMVLVGAALIARLLSRQPAAARHAVWVGALLAAFSLPGLSLVSPKVRVAALSPRPIVLPPTGSGSREVAPLPSGSGSLASSVEPSFPREKQTPWTAMVLGAWLLGALGLLGSRLRAEARLRVMLRGREPASKQLVGEFERALAAAGNPRGVSLQVSTALDSPAVAGVFRSIVLLPVAAHQWGSAELRAAFTHELAHVSRRDGLWNLLADLTRILFWCNPAVWFAARRLRAESERACDDRVLQGGSEAVGYAHLLVELAARQSRNPRSSQVVLAMARLSELESRLLAVLDQRVRRRPVSSRRSRALAGLALMLALPTSALTPVARDQSPRKPEPDLRGDSLANPRSERLSLDVGGYAVPAPARLAVQGPDSLLVRTLIAALDEQPEHEGDLVRERAYWALTRVRAGGLVEPLLESLQHPDWRVQAYAAWALGTAREGRAAARLAPLLTHPVWRLRAMAAAAIRAIGDPSVQRAMIPALSDPAWQVRVEAVEYFATFDLPASTRAALLTDRLRDRHIAVRHAAERALTP